MMTDDKKTPEEMANERIQVCLKSRRNELNLSKLGLTNIPITLLENTIKLSQHLTILHLSNNQISKIENLDTLTSLTSLNLKNNKISKIVNLDTLTRINSLSLSNNKISKIENLDALTSLNYLYLNDNQISNIENIDALVNLIVLGLNSNKISKLENLNKLFLLKELYLSNNQIHKLENISELTRLTGLNLHTNQINKIESLGSLTRITRLYLGNNQISKIENLDNSLQLKELFLNNNQISEIKNLNSLTALTTLDISKNKISKLENLETLTVLTRLRLNNNYISKLDNLNALIELTNLNLATNQISKLENLNNLFKLVEIYLNNNQIFEITKGELKELLAKKRLVKIKINNNPFCDCSVLTFEDSLRANHLNVLKLYINNKNNPLQPPTKVVFLGNHASGKTSCLNILQYDEQKSVDDSTHVLNIQYILPSDYPSRNKNKKQLFTASCYDFGGQDFYHGIYRIFLQNASTAVLLINPDSNRNELGVQNTVKGELKKAKTQYFDVRYWRGLLNYMQSKKQTTNKLSLFAVQSHGDLHTADWSLPGILNMPTNNVNSEIHNIDLKGFHHLNLMNKKSVSGHFFSGQFASYIHEQHTSKATELDDKTTNFVADLMDRANRTQLTTEDYLPTRIGDLKDKLSNLTAEDNKGDEMMMLLAQVEQYHFAGMLLYEKNLSINHSNKIADFIVWLNPQGLVTFIHQQILSEQSLQKNNGKIDEDDFNKIIDGNIKQATDSKYKKPIKELLEIHQVIFKHEYKDGKPDNIEYIIPNYLPLSTDDSSYELIYQGMGAPAFCLSFTDFIPVGMINQFVNLFGRQPDKKLFWRDAMIFNLSNENKDKLFKVHLHIDMQRLTISVHITHLAEQNNHKIISYLYYCIMNAYWSYLTNLPTVSYAEFSSQGGYKSIDMSKYDNNWELIQQADNFVQALFSDNQKGVFNNHSSVSRIPCDMYISRDGENFVKYDELFKEDILLVPCYIPKYILDERDKKQSNKKNDDYHQPTTFDNSERMIRQTEPIPAQDFQPFTNEPLNKIARIFISYSHLDREYKESLMVHLSLLERQGHHIFDDTKIGTGKFDSRIQDELARADIVVFMMSANFFKSDYIFNKELTKVLSKNISGGKKQVVIPVLVKSFDFESLSHLVDADGVFKEENLKAFKAVAHKNSEVDIKTDSDEHYKTILKDCGEYLFRPYYRDEKNGIGKILPIELWGENERNSAYTQISQVVREAIKQL